MNDAVAVTPSGAREARAIPLLVRGKRARFRYAAATGQLYKMNRRCLDLARDDNVLRAVIPGEVEASFLPQIIS